MPVHSSSRLITPHTHSPSHPIQFPVRVRHPYGVSPKSLTKFVAGFSPLPQVSRMRDHLSIENGLSVPIHALGINTGSSDRGPIERHSSQLTPTFKGPSLVLCWFLSCQTGVCELPLAQVRCFCVFPQHGLHSFSHHPSLSPSGF